MTGLGLNLVPAVRGKPKFVIKSRSQAEQLIREIRHAVRRSIRTGGGYGVYRRGQDGRLAVNIEVVIGNGSPEHVE